MPLVLLLKVTLLEFPAMAPWVKNLMAVAQVAAEAQVCSLVQQNGLKSLVLLQLHRLQLLLGFSPWPVSCICSRCGKKKKKVIFSLRFSPAPPIFKNNFSHSHPGTIYHSFSTFNHSNYVIYNVYVYYLPTYVHYVYVLYMHITYICVYIHKC